MHVSDSSLPRRLPRLVLLTAALALGGVTPSLVQAQAQATPQSTQRTDEIPVMGLEQLTRLVLQHNP